MATGKTHDSVTVWLLVPLFILCHWYFKLDLYTSGLLTIGYLIGGVLLSPDLDTRSRPFYRWGPFRFIWWPYQWMVRHRSSLSHGLFIAPFFRLLYLTAVFLLGDLLLSIALTPDAHITHWRSDVVAFFRRHIPSFLLFSIGIWAGCLLHIALDALFSSLPRKNRRR